MKIDTIITSVNDSHDYTSFVKPICNAWTSAFFRDAADAKLVSVFLEETL